jgi:hypothetical protein
LCCVLLWSDRRFFAADGQRVAILDAQQVNIVQNHIVQADGNGFVGVFASPIRLGLELLDLSESGVRGKDGLVGFDEKATAAS